MNGVHDMGGMHGFGAIEREVDEPVFHAPWEGRVRAMVTLSRDRKYFNIDAFRYGIERMEPAHYLRAPYFERWLASLERNLIEHGFLSAEEVEARTEDVRRHPAAAPPHASAATPMRPAPEKASDAPPPRLAPRFAVGDGVVTRNLHPAAHTRLPRYARGKRGVIQLVHGAQIFPDSHALGLGENPQMLYTVRFDGRELWGESAEPRQTVSLDLWESYLEPGPV
jgi:nitrile hydratase subunit beta